MQQSGYEFTMFYYYLSVGGFRQDSANVDLVELESLVVGENSLTIEYLDAKNLIIFKYIKILIIPKYLIFHILLDDILSMEFSFYTFALSMCKKKPKQSSKDSNWNSNRDIYLNFQL